MAKKTPCKKRKPNTLDAISGTDAIEVLHILANRDKELSKEIDVIAKDLLADVSIDEVADCVQAELESLAVEDVWHQLGHLIDWCDCGTAWIQLFCAEARPYRETFYWEAVARMMSEYLAEYQTESPGDVLTDCLIATQCPPTSDDREALTEFHNMWQEILIDSQQEIDTLMHRDLELAQQEGTHETVAALYAADHQRWQKG